MENNLWIILQYVMEMDGGPFLLQEFLWLELEEVDFEGDSLHQGQTKPILII